MGHELEARALEMIQDIVRTDGRISLHRTHEGALADFCITTADDPLRGVGCQLKTTGCVQTRKRARGDLQFSHTAGYDGMLLLLVALLPTATKIWILHGSAVRASALNPPLEHAQRRRVYDWEAASCHADDLCSVLLASFHNEQIVLKDVEDWLRPQSPTQLAEFEGQRRMEKWLPLQYTRPRIDHLHYDYLAQGRNVWCSFKYSVS